ncbi:MAG: TlpA family protein disulfide reductase [Gammaproteobacteria bacterium]|jgi:peroxiredoxin|nr:TlpA family protein disulfide reductase [Gammaproteobacteria bacterium]MBT3488461.1 TlpA family protein disulfide reductase [Gammaproteobacteria bacterium]MBT3719867.1 TlpA family protein disulfide reductase [Gammaproteobacteria bacterium]MBT3846168.1 TlpA family protein disulfide reductase [Gammaproteobacteria bacterium]MBT3893186.1 TlpA family protein disulfide reductase [Gammaproteobacteria bacterium]
MNVNHTIPTLNTMFRTLFYLLLTLPLFNSHALTIQDSVENDFEIQVMEAEGDLLTLWITDLVEEERPHLDQLLGELQQSGVEVWSTRVLEDLFLTRDDASILSLDGSHIAALIEAAHQHSDKQILLVSYDKMSIALLRGIRRWQQQYQNRNRISGAALLYPNLFSAPARAGDQPTAAPILSQTNIPVTLFQPEKGQHAKRISKIVEALWEAESAAILFPLANIRDWYIMHEPGKYPAEQPVREQFPQHLKQIHRQMQFSSFPDMAAATEAQPQRGVGEKNLSRLIEIPEQPLAPNFTLQNLNGDSQSLTQLRGKVVLVNFWASWCPPCIEEMPSMNHIYQRYKAHGLEIAAINFQESPSEISQFMAKVKIDFPVLFDLDGEVAQQWNVFSMPTSFLVDRSGRVRYSVNRSIHWDQPKTIQVLDQLMIEKPFNN